MTADIYANLYFYELLVTCKLVPPDKYYNVYYALHILRVSSRIMRVQWIFAFSTCQSGLLNQKHYEIKDE